MRVSYLLGMSIWLYTLKAFSICEIQIPIGVKRNQELMRFITSMKH